MGFNNRRLGVKRYMPILIVGFTFLMLLKTSALFAADILDIEKKLKYNPDYAKIADYHNDVGFFQKVYITMLQNYYHPVTPESLKKFIYVFNTILYPQFHATQKTRDYIKWRSAAYLVDALKAPDDIFSAFYPPRDAKQYEQTVLGKKIDLGIEGVFVKKGYKVTDVQIRSDAFEKGLKENDILLAVDNTSVFKYSEKELQEKLTPLEGTTVSLKFLDSLTGREKVIDAISKEYFKQFVFMVPVDVPGVYCLKIERFNRVTGEDMERYMPEIIKNGKKGLIIDLRGNPGGPPLAAREIAGFFLHPDEEFAYFQKRNKPKSMLYVPQIPEDKRYHGNMAILVNKKSGSASELFAGILQSKGRAVVIGQNTAGQVFLKSMFPFDDGSMLLLVTARGFHPDGSVFSFGGVVPSKVVTDDTKDLVKYAAKYLASEKH